MLMKLGAIVVISPIFWFPGISVAIAGGWCGKLYIKAQLSIKREMSNARAPILANFGAATSGLSMLHANNWRYVTYCCVA